MPSVADILELVDLALTFAVAPLVALVWRMDRKITILELSIRYLQHDVEKLVQHWERENNR